MEEVSCVRQWPVLFDALPNVCLKYSSNVAVPPAKSGKHPSCCVCVVHVYTRSLLEAIHTSVEL